MRIAIATAVAFAAAALTVAPAHAEENAYAPEPFARVASPLPPNNDRGNLVRMQIEGVGEDWGLRTFAEQMDARWQGLRVRSHGTCDERPTYWCVRVEVGTWDPDQQLALMGTPFMGVADIGALDRTVYLNNYYEPVSKYAVAAHEFGHVLGLNHHQQEGICGIVPDQTELSWAEDRAMRPYYGHGVTRGSRD